MSETNQPPRRSRLRRLMVWGGGLLLILILLVALLPTIAGWVAPGYAADAINKSINGKASVGKVSLSWFGGQRVGPVTVTDTQGKQVASLNIELSKGLASLASAATGKMDLGEVKLSGSASVVRGPDGKLNILSLAKPAPPGATPAPGSGSGAGAGGGGATLPKGLKATVLIDKLAVEYTDASASNAPNAIYHFSAPALSGRAAIDGPAADANLNGAFDFQRTAQSKPEPGGTLDLKANITGFADSAGKLTPELAKVDADVRIQDFAVAIADALAGMDSKLVAGIGEKLQASLTAKGSLSDADATVTAKSAAIDANLAFKSAAGVLTNPRPGTISIKTAGMMPLLGLEQALKNQENVTLQRLPDLALTLDSVRIPLPINGKPLDLRGGTFVLDIKSTETTGSVRVPNPDGTAGQPQPYRLAPLTAKLASEDLGKRVSFTANTSATLGGQSAGTLAANFDAIDPLDNTGKPRQGMPGRVQGQVTMAGVATAIAQPFVAAAGIDLAKDVGPTLDLTLKAAAGDDEAGTPAAAPPAAPGAANPTHIALDVKSANVNAIARLTADGKTIRTKPKGIELKVANLGPLATRFMQKSGLTVDSATSLAVTVTDLVADLDRLAPKTPGAQADLRAVTGMVRIETSAAAGKLAVAGQPVKSYELAPLIAMLDAKDLGKGVTIKADTSAKLDGAPAGTIGVNLAATNLLSADGSLSKSLPAINGTVAVADISTAIAQPFVEQSGLDLPNGVGPKLALNLIAVSKGGAVAPGEIPPTDLDLTIKSAGVNSTLALALEGRTLKKRGGEGVISIKSPGTLAGKAAKNAGVSLSDGGYAKATFRDFAVQFDDAWAPQLDKSAADLEVNVGGFSIGLIPQAPAAVAGQPPAPAPRAADPLALNSIVANVKLAPGATPTVDLKGSGSHQNAAFLMQGSMQLAGLIGKDATGKAAITPANCRPLGTLDINNLPTSLASMVMPAPAPSPDGKPGMDVARLIRDAVGPTATIKLASNKPATGGDMARDVALNVTAQNLNGGAAAVVDDRALALNKLDFKANVTQELAASFIDMLGSGLASKPTLAGPAALTLTATPFTIPLAAGKPDFAKASGNAAVKVGLQGRTLVNNVILKGENGQNRDIGTVGLENVLLAADIPLQALAEGSAAKLAKVTVTAGVLGGPDRKILDLTAGGQVNLAGGKPQGDLNADLNLNVLDARWLDTFLNQPGLIADGVGQTATVEAKALVKFPKGASSVPAGSEGAAPAFESASITGSIKAPRLSTTQPLKATALPDRLTLDEPMVLKWNIDPAWANLHLLTPKDAKPGDKLSAEFASATDLTVSVFKMGLATDASNTPLRPGVFALDASVESPGTTFKVGQGKSASQAVMKNFKTRISGGKDPGVLGFSLTVDDAGGGPGPGGKPAVSFAGGIYSVSDAAGKLTTDKAKITAKGTAAPISTALVDALAQQKGLIVEALGPSVSLDVNAEGLSKTAGNLVVIANSPRADAQLKGTIRDGTLVTSGKPDVRLKVITPELGGMLVSGLPMVGTFEKKAEDGPAMIQASDLVVPIDGQLQKLNGKVVLDLGKARFASSSAFSKLLKFTGQKDAGLVGRRLEPVNVDIKDGVATYDKVMVPLGEFDVASRGTVDLVQKKLDVITYIPFGALTDEAAGLFNTNLGKIVGGAVPGLEKATMVPFRTKGTFEKQDTKPDLELFAKETLTNLRPDKAVGNILDDLLKKKKDK